MGRRQSRAAYDKAIELMGNTAETAYPTAAAAGCGNAHPVDAAARIAVNVANEGRATGP